MTATAPRTAPTGGRPVIVGVDNGMESDIAVEWAAREAVARSVRLRVLRTYDWPPVPSWSTGVDPSVNATLLVGSARVADRAVRVAEERVPGVRADEFVLKGRADDTLIAAGANAGLVVLGHRHLNVLQRMIARSVSAPVAAHAPCPVVVVNGPAETADPAAFVVAGVAGKPGDADVLGFAFEYAARHHAPLDAVLCWHRDTLADARWRGITPPPESAELIVAEAVAGWRSEYPEVEVHAAVVRNSPAAGLVAMATAQRLLVVGRPHRRIASGALLPSVTHAVLRTATCPVAVVPTR